MPTPTTIEEFYEYRITNILRQWAKDTGIEDCTPDEVFQMLWENADELGRLLHEDMLVWMSEEDWIKALENKS